MRLAAVPLDDAEQRPEDALERGGELLRAALAAELAGQRLGERREARDVGEQRGAAHPLGQHAARGQGAPAVTGDVRLDVVAPVALATGLRPPRSPVGAPSAALGVPQAGAHGEQQGVGDSGSSLSSGAKSQETSDSVDRSLVARTVAERGLPSISEISPK